MALERRGFFGMLFGGLAAAFIPKEFVEQKRLRGQQSNHVICDDIAEDVLCDKCGEVFDKVDQHGRPHCKNLHPLPNTHYGPRPLRLNDEPHHLVWDSTRKVWTHPDDGSPAYEDDFSDYPIAPQCSGELPKIDQDLYWSMACSGAFVIDGWGYDFKPEPYIPSLCQCEEPNKSYYSTPGIYDWKCLDCGKSGKDIRIV